MSKELSEVDPIVVVQSFCLSHVPMRLVCASTTRWQKASLMNTVRFTKLGPHTWARVCDNAAGAHQSPINIETHKAVYDDALMQQPLELAVTTCEAATLVNTGHSFQVKLQSDAGKLTLSEL